MSRIGDFKLSNILSQMLHTYDVIFFCRKSSMTAGTTSCKASTWSLKVKIYSQDNISLTARVKYVVKNKNISVAYRSQKSWFFSLRHQELSFLNREIVTRSQKLCKNLDLFTNTILKLLWSDRKYVAKAEVGSSLISLYRNTSALHSGEIYKFLVW